MSDRALLAKECDTVAGKLSEASKALREAAKALMLLENADRMLAEANTVRDRALDLLSEVGK